MTIEDTSSTEYYLKRIILRDAHEEDVDDAEAALEALKLFGTELGGVMKDLLVRLRDLDQNV